MADPDGALWGFRPPLSSGSGIFLRNGISTVISEADESEYVISNVLSNVLVLNYLSFKENDRNILVT